jgi:two-component system sensor histidine kinase/response regulator
MDWKMPVMDGVETVRQMQRTALSKMPRHHGHRLRAGRSHEQCTGAWRAGPNVLTKPVTASTLLEAIGETLHKGMESPPAAKSGWSTAMIPWPAQRSRMLLVEDNDMNQELAMELLANAGIDVVLAEHGKDCVGHSGQRQATLTAC